MIKALVISNDIQGLDKKMFDGGGKAHIRVAEVTADFDPDLDSYDLLIVPNGSDHVAMLKIKDKVRRFLDEGNSLFCFDGWFTNWVPGNRWVMDNTRKTIDIRYSVKTDRYDLFDDVDINHLIFSHGISGWWACGFIEPNPEADVIMHDTWQRPMLVLDENTTNGVMLLSSSGPIADYTYGITDDESSHHSIAKLYRNMLNLITIKKKEVPL